MASTHDPVFVPVRVLQYTVQLNFFKKKWYSTHMYLGTIESGDLGELRWFASGRAIGINIPVHRPGAGCQIEISLTTYE
eukprot:COSAG02_NODE_788_length_17190_cov_18.177403_4_plen_79_part_00